MGKATPRCGRARGEDEKSLGYRDGENKIDSRVSCIPRLEGGSGEGHTRPQLLEVVLKALEVKTKWTKPKR